MNTLLRRTLLSRSSSQPLLQIGLGRRFYAAEASDDLRARLTTGVKDALKNKNRTGSTVLRGVLSEVYAADKKEDKLAPNATIVSIIRKAVQKRVDAFDQYIQAGRPELADKETEEAAFLTTFLPPQLAEQEIDAILKEVVAEQGIKLDDGKRAKGALIKAFFAKVDKSTCDSGLVSKRVEALLA